MIGWLSREADSEMEFGEQTVYQGPSGSIPAERGGGAGVGGWRAAAGWATGPER